MPADLDAVFAAVSHPIRRAMLEQLAAGSASVGQLAQGHGVSAPAITKHVRALESAGLLVQEPEGRLRRCNLDPRPLAEAFGWLTRTRVFWQERLDALESLLATLEEPKHDNDDNADT